MTILPLENGLTLGKVSWQKFKSANFLTENSYLELLDNRIKDVIRKHGPTGGLRP